MTSSGAGRKRVLVIIGTRPEGIKLAPVVTALDKLADRIETRVVLTGQHTTLTDQVVEVFDMRISRDLGIMREGQDLYDVVHACLDGLRDVVREWRPDMLLVEGDTASVFVGGLVGFFERVRVGHVEAGLRSRDKWRPYPEEIFRRLTGVVADVHFAPTQGARTNLLAEGVPADSIHVTGNTVVDALRSVAEQPHEASDAALRAALASGHGLVLVTAHRRESFGQPMRDAFMALRDLADRHTDIDLLVPLHPNPNVIRAAEVLRGHDRIHITTPLNYRDMVLALEHAMLVITDSGGIQEEAASFGNRVLLMRDVTERPEAEVAGFVTRVGTDPARITREANALLGIRSGSSPGPDRPAMQNAPARGLKSLVAATANPYGDGRAGERIADIIQHRLTGAPRTTDDWTGPA